MKQFKYIGTITEQELKEKTVHACINEDGYRCILIKNSVEKRVLSKYDTDNLEIKLNTVLVFNECEYYFHIITSKKNDRISNEGFELVYEYVFRKIPTPVYDNELTNLILTIEDYFRITPEKDNRKLQIGIWGELFCVKWLYTHGCEKIIEKYHNNFYLKHDVEFSQKLRMEIKTSVDQKRIHHFSHDQICRNDVEVLVASLIVEEAQQGTSLLDLFNCVLGYVSDCDDRLAIQKMMKMCGVGDDNPGLTFSETKAHEDIRFFNANTLPMLPAMVPQGVTKIEYDVDCGFGIPLDIENVLSLL